MHVLRHTQEGITQALQTPSPDFRTPMPASEFVPAPGMQPASGADLHYLCDSPMMPMHALMPMHAPSDMTLLNVAVMTEPNDANDFYQRHGVHVFEGDSYWPAD